MRETTLTKEDFDICILLWILAILLIVIALITYLKFNEKQATSIYVPDEGIRVSKDQLSEITIPKTVSAKAQPLYLCDVFANVFIYEPFMNFLAGKGFCHPFTHICTDRKKGNKGFLIAIIKHLHPLGYYKKGTNLTDEQVMEIALNTFDWNISIDRVKQIDPIDFDLSFIPLASELI